MKPSFNKLSQYGKDKDCAYKAEIILGDCYCPCCSTHIEMTPGKNDNNFHGVCPECKKPHGATIEIEASTMTGVWKEIK